MKLRSSKANEPFTEIRTKSTPDVFRSMVAFSPVPRRAIAALATDPKLMEKSGQVLIVALAQEYGFTDIDGTQPRPLTLEKA